MQSRSVWSLVRNTVAAFSAACLVLPGLAGGKPAVETLRVPGLAAPADIRIDRWGVPHIEEMEKLEGQEPAMWQWGKLHFNLNEHPFAAAVDDALRVRINVGPIAKNGSEYTPSQSLPRPSDFRQMNGPSVRLVVDVGQWDNSRAVNHPGQSGDPSDPHYRDLAEYWRSGRYFQLAYSRKAVDRVTERVIHLVP